jgi:hypothetical protein
VHPRLDSVVGVDFAVFLLAVEVACWTGCTPTGECTEDSSVDVSSGDYTIDAVDVTGPCTPLHACNKYAFSSSFCGTYAPSQGTASTGPACTFSIVFHDEPGTPSTCTVTAERANRCGKPESVRVDVINIDGGVPRCFDWNNDTALSKATYATPLDAGSE